mgnify:CR=1 FL=1|jgi:hypothetical protein
MLKKIIRKRKHLSFVRNNIQRLTNEILKDAISIEKVCPIKVNLIKKYSKYLSLLEF